MISVLKKHALLAYVLSTAALAFFLLGVGTTHGLVTTTMDPGERNAQVSELQAFLATVDSASLESEVRTAAETVVSANAGATFSASTQARLLNEVHAVMKSNLEASLAAEAAAGASTSN